MAILNIPTENRKLTDAQEIREYLAGVGIFYENWNTARGLSESATAEEVLAAYAPEINRLKEMGGYVTADVIDVKPETPNLDVMLNKFNKEHFHDEDEVRFIVEGHGLFHIHPKEEGKPVIALEVVAGDLISVPSGTWHWFDLCSDRRIRAIRLFLDASGWSPHYTNTGVDKDFIPACFGPAWIAPQQPLIKNPILP
ncbi:MAG: cupin domain-containing protein [Candidatus Sumerlaeia bacterium]|nr:cupin domain-containing protein [Candidatus Sumerlaeia bacterium]